jgi:sulfur carrier protein
METPTRTIIANGRREESSLPCTLEAFLVSRGLPPKSVVVEHNGEAVVPSEFGSRTLRPGDRVEIVRIVAGG